MAMMGLSIISFIFSSINFGRKYIVHIGLDNKTVKYNKHAMNHFVIIKMFH